MFQTFVNINTFFFIFHCRLGFISQWGALAGRYAALCPPGWPWTATQTSASQAAQRMPFHSPSNGKWLFCMFFFCSINAIPSFVKPLLVRFLNAWKHHIMLTWTKHLKIYYEGEIVVIKVNHVWTNFSKLIWYEENLLNF